MTDTPTEPTTHPTAETLTRPRAPRSRVAAALRTTAARLTPPDLWTHPRPSIDDLWTYARCGGWAPAGAAALRRVMTLYTALVALPAALPGHAAARALTRRTGGPPTDTPMRRRRPPAGRDLHRRVTAAAAVTVSAAARAVGYAALAVVLTAYAVAWIGERPTRAAAAAAPLGAVLWAVPPLRAAAAGTASTAVSAAWNLLLWIFP